MTARCFSVGVGQGKLLDGWRIAVATFQTACNRPHPSVVHRAAQHTEVEMRCPFDDLDLVTRDDVCGEKGDGDEATALEDTSGTPR